MRAGEFPDGAHVLRARIDMAHPNMIMRDPLLLRIRHAPHYRRGDALVHLPAVRLRPRAVRRDRGDHALALHARVQGQPGDLRLAGARGRVRAAARADRVRPAGAGLHGAEQAEAAAPGQRGARGGWDDPRMPTIAGLRRRGVTPEAIRDVRRDDRRGPVGRADRARHLRARRARRSQHAGAAGDVRGPPAQGGDHELSRGPGRDARRAATTRTTCR